jgi:hypothetical protein
VNLIAHIFNRAIVPDNQSLAEVRVDALPFRVDSDQVQFFPTSVDNLLDTKIQLATHDDGVRFSCKAVEEVQTDAVDFVVDVEAFDVCSMIPHDHIDELVNGG